MQMDEKKKMIFVMGHEMDHFIEKKTDLNRENIFILQSDEPVIAPFGDMMRDIIIAVYQENVEEIFVVGGEDIRKNKEDILSKIQEHEEMQEKFQTLDYLFKNCMPEFSEGDISKWLAGSKLTKDRVRNSVSVIRNHPLMPSSVKVRGLVIDRENEQLSEIRVS
ncbi:carbonic anhydrase [Bacillota bacterium Lsc_1132]